MFVTAPGVSIATSISVRRVPINSAPLQASPVGSVASGRLQASLPPLNSYQLGGGCAVDVMVLGERAPHTPACTLVFGINTLVHQQSNSLTKLSLALSLVPANTSLAPAPASVNGRARLNPTGQPQLDSIEKFIKLSSVQQTVTVGTRQNVHDGCDWMKLVTDVGDDTERANSSTAKCPEQIRIRAAISKH